MKFKSNKISSLSFAFMLVISVVAFAFIIGSEVEMVRGANNNDKKTIVGTEYTYLTDGRAQEGAGWYKQTDTYAIKVRDSSLLNTLNGVTEERWTSPTGEVYSKSGVDSYGDVIWRSTEGVTINEAQRLATENGRLPIVSPVSVVVAPSGAPDTASSSLVDDVTYIKDIDGVTRKYLGDGSKYAVWNQKNGNYDVFQSSDNKLMGSVGSSLSLKDIKSLSSTGQGKMKVKLFGEVPFAWGQLIEGVAWAVGVIAIVRPVLDLFGVDKDQSAAITKSMMAGIMAGKLTYALIGKGGVWGITKQGGWASRNLGFGYGQETISNVLSSPYFAGAVGLVTAWLVYNSQYEKEKIKTESASFSCLPWQAPHGGSACELCNDGTLPCSEYRCKALGQSCSIINKGTLFEMCVNTNTRDVSPPIIKPWDDALTEGFSYFDVKDMPPGAGFKIKSDTTTTGCVAPFTPIEFGITTDEPAQCKIDVEPKGNYSKMASYFGGDNLYSYNHTEVLSLPSVENFKNSSLQLENGKELKFYMRCRDSNGNANEADYELKVCIDPSPDTTAPIILGTSINNGGCVANGADNTSVQFYVNEPAQCRWDFNDMDFDQMKSNMSCSSSVTEINALLAYTCNSVMTGIARDGTNFFVRCKDQPQGVNESKRNENMESYAYALRGSNPLKLKNIKPNETIYGAVRPTPVELYAETMFGCDNNKAICYYSSTGEENSYVAFFDTNKADGVHTQRLDLYDGTQIYFVKCVDSGGNVAIEQTTFKLEIDTNAPVIARVYEEDDNLLIVTPRNSECVFTNDNCDFLFEEGTVMHFANSTRHITPWIPDKSYYIKCRDEYRSEPVDCSLIVRPTDNFL